MIAAECRTEDDARWTEVRARNKDADGQFVYSVRTTGVYCRPSCPSRLANPANVAFHMSTEAAEAAGFRPCKRCKPDEAPLADRQAELVAAACRKLTTSEVAPTLDELAYAAGLSPHHFHRLFRAQTGLTPRDYARAERARRMREGLADAASVTDAIYGAGYGSGSRFYERADETLGMTARQFREGGAGETIRFAVGETSLGAILVAASSRGICAILLGDDPDALARDLQDRMPKASLIGGDSEFEQLVAQVVALVEAPQLGHRLPLDIRGTAFQQRVWNALLAIPAGRTASYSEIADAIGAPAAVRAVAQACAANRLAIAIPCHRVVRTDGALSGYRWGVERKQELLEREAAA